SEQAVHRIHHLHRIAEGASGIVSAACYPGPLSECRYRLAVKDYKPGQEWSHECDVHSRSTDLIMSGDIPPLFSLLYGCFVKRIGTEGGRPVERGLLVMELCDTSLLREMQMSLSMSARELCVI